MYQETARETLSELWRYQEFQVVWMLLSWLIMLIIVFIAMIVLLHIVYILGYNSPLYYKKSPNRGWSKRLLPTALLLIGVLSGIYLFMDYITPSI